MSSNHEQDETLIGGRQRRSAAAKNKAWSALMGTGKHKLEDEEEQQEAPGKHLTSECSQSQVFSSTFYASFRSTKKAEG